MTIFTIPYNPRPLQKKLHHDLARFSVLVAHRRFGKTVFCVNEIIQAAVTANYRAPRCAYIAPLYRQAKTVAWDMLKHYSQDMQKAGWAKFNEAELRVDYGNGGRAQLFGADSPDHLRGVGLDKAVMDEYAQMNPRVFPEIIRPALSDRKGSAIFMGTPMGRNHFYELYQYALEDRMKNGVDAEWRAIMHKSSETNIIDPQELISARAGMTDAEYEQEFECSFTAAIKGAYYASELAKLRKENRICPVSHETSLPVTTGWDLGINDQTAIWYAQRIGKEIRFIDYEEFVDTPLMEIARHVLNDKPYNYAAHFLPHDAKVREMTTGKTRMESMESVGLKNIDVCRQQPVHEGINATRLLLAHAWFDEVKCHRGLIALESYQKSFDERLQTFRNQPLHNWASHAADAMRTFGHNWSAAPGHNEPGYSRPRVRRTVGGRRR